jgi:hypothetical protein
VPTMLSEEPLISKNVFDERMAGGENKLAAIVEGFDHLVELAE